jgi:hypothetical protein
MSSLNLVKNDPLRAEVSLLRAYFQQKSSLEYEISNLKIRNNYFNNSSNSRALKDIISTLKLSIRRLEDIRFLKSSASSPELDSISAEPQKIEEIMEKSMNNVNKLEAILADTQQAEHFNSLLKEKYNSLKERWERMKIVNKANEKLLRQNEYKMETFQGLEAEVLFYNKELENINIENLKMTSLKNVSESQKQRNVERVKIYSRLSAEAIKLRSKRLFCTELQKHIKTAELELEHHQIKASQEKERVDELERESIDDRPIEYFEEEVQKVNEKTEKLEKRIEELLKEKEENLESPKGKSIGDSKVIESDDSLTLSITSLFNGFQEIRREKESLIVENNELKQMISKLFAAKV